MSDEAFHSIAKALRDNPEGVIVRKGWEFDGNWHPWKAKSANPFVSFYRRLKAHFTSNTQVKEES